MSAPSVAPSNNHSTPSHGHGNGPQNNNHSPTNGRSPRPSDARRKALHGELSLPIVSNFFPIERYYEAADKVYESFQMAISEMGSNQNTLSSLDDAYVYGKRYCSFCIDAIPQHNYYSAKKYVGLKNKHTQQMVKVMGQLEDVVAMMDIQEAQKQQKERERAEREAAERERLQRKRLEDFQKSLEKQKQHHVQGSSTSSADVQASAMSKLAALRPPSNPPSYYDVAGNKINPVGADDPLRIPRDPSGEGEDMGKPSSRYRLPDSDEEDDLNAMPPPMLPPEAGLPPPPPYNQALTHRQFLGPAAVAPKPLPHESASSALQIDPARVATPSLARRESQNKIKPKMKSMPMSKQQEFYRREYEKYQHEGKIIVSGIDTYQGRINDSTNGCTVISALVAATHLSSNKGVSDSQIVGVIDRHCGPLLREIRSKLGLGGHALIIPSDVHDHLVDRKIFKQEDFVGAAGGNIMDEAHLGSFLKLLQDGDENGPIPHTRAAATLFFREHVISIVKMPIGNGRGWYYDLVDSMPTVSDRNRSMASRTRCVDMDALTTLLKWYTSRKFSSSNCSHIDQHPWDDMAADFDPRVFQGFVWASDKKPQKK